MEDAKRPVQPVRQLLIAAAREFNTRRFFEAHEVLEDGLETCPDELWDLCVGLIQIAVGYHKLTQHLRGPARMLGLGLQKLDRFPADAAGLQLEALRRRVRADLERLRAGPLDVQEVVRTPPRIAFHRAGPG